MEAKHRYRLWLWSASVLGVICFIFANSLTPAEVSAEESRSFLDAILALFPDITHHVVRKLAHVAEYALLGVHFALAPVLLPIPSRLANLLALLFGAVIALLDEGIQYFVPGRGASLGDAVIDYVGYLMALFLAFAFFFILSVMRRRKKNV